MKRLHELTPIGRGRRLRPAAQQVLQAYGIHPEKLKQITEASNTIFHVMSSTSDEYVLRITAPKSCHSPDETRSEIAWLHAIAEETDIGVPEPIARLDGDFVSDLPIVGEVGSMSCAVYRWVPGVMLNAVRTPENVTRMGSLMARLHLHAAAFHPPAHFRIRTYNHVFPYADQAFPQVEPIVLIGEHAAEHLSARQCETYANAVHMVSEEIRHLVDEGPLRVMHGDLHVWNVKVDGDRLYALDFEDMLWGTPQQDIATTLYYFRWLDDYKTLLSAFRAGYEMFLPWPEEHPKQIETLIMGRALLLANYVAVSEDSEDRAFAPTYLERIETRLRTYLSAMRG